MPHRLKFILKKLMRMVLLLVAVSLVSFFLLTLSPLDPVRSNVGQAAMGSMSEAQIKKLETYWGKDQPPLNRYFSWAADVLHGDLGISLLYRRSVASVISEGLRASLFVLVLAWTLSGVLGLGLGLWAGMNRGRWPDKLVRGYCFFLSATPAFWLALLFLLLFSVTLGWLPIGFSVPIGMESAAVTWGDRLLHAVLPALTLSVTGIANIALHTREKTLDILACNYILYARARGESTRSIALRHALRGASLPAITLQFASIGELIGGSVLIEQVFSYPGLGRTAVTAGLGGDLPLLLGITLVTTTLVFGGNLAADLLYGVLDPRIRRGAAKG